MAEHLELKDIKDLPVTPYEEVRDALATGDLLFASGEYLVSKTIQKFTESPWSVRFIPLSKYLTDYEHEKPYKGRIALARCEGIDAEIISGLAGFGIDELTRTYRNDDVAEIWASEKSNGRRSTFRQSSCMSVSLMQAKNLSMMSRASLHRSASGSTKQFP